MQSKPKILYVLPPSELYSPDIGGALATFSMQQGLRLSEMGYEVHVAAVHDEERVYPVGEFHALSGATRASLSMVRRAISNRINRPLRGYDYCYFEKFLSALQPVLRKIQPEVVFCMNDWQTPYFVKREVPSAKVHLRLSNECSTLGRRHPAAIAALDTIWPVSTYIKDWTVANHPIQRIEIKVLANGADLSTFWPEVDAMTRIMDPDYRLKALFISRIDPSKGPDLAAQAVALARKQGAAIDFDVAGATWFGNHHPESEFLRSLRQAVENLDGRFLGHVSRDKVPEVVREHDILLFPVRANDPMPQVVFEAMASALAIVTCPRGGVPEACGDAAWWADTNNADSLAKALVTFASDRTVLADYKQRSVNRAAEMTWDTNALLFANRLRSSGIVPVKQTDSD